MSRPSFVGLGIPSTNQALLRIDDPTLGALIRQERWKDSKDYLEDILRDGAGSRMQYYWSGTARFMLNDFVGAVQAFRIAERLELDTPSLHTMLGLSYYNLNQFKLFVEQLAKSIALEPDAYEPHYYLGRYYGALHLDFQRALHHFERALQARSNDPKALYYGGHCLQMLGRDNESIHWYSQAAQLVERNGNRFSLAHQAMGETLLRVDPQQALKWAEEALAIEELDANYVLLARVYDKLGRKSEAVALLKKTINNNPSSRHARYFLSRLYHRMGEREAAEAEARAFRALTRIYGEL